jgi:SAM-dependent methyltransferase
MALAPRIRTSVEERRNVSLLMRELGEHMGAAARVPANLAPRPCPVCLDDSGDGTPVLTRRGPVYAFHRCPGCGLVYAPHVLRPEVTRQLYGERPIYRAYWDHMRADAEAMRGREIYGDLVRRLVAATPGRETALDVSCGFGKLVAELGPHFREVVGLETNRRTAQAGAQLFGVSIVPQRLERLQRPDASVDLIVLNQVLEHLTDVRSVIRAAHRLLRPGGVLWIGIPHGASLGMRLLGGSHSFVATHLHVNMFNARALRALAAAEAFRIADLRTDDVIDVSAADWLAERLPPTLPLLAAPAFLLDQLVKQAARRTSLPSRLGMGAHLEAVFVKEDT